DASKAEYYTKKNERRRLAINNVLWNEEAGMWFDFSLTQNRSRKNFYVSNIFPLFAGCGHQDDNLSKHQLSAVTSYIKDNKLEFSGGIPTSLHHTGQQWDFPNAWPPLQHVWIVGLANAATPSLTNIAFTNAQKWVRSVYLGWERTRVIFEKNVKNC
ncbi:trehalase-like, partial [Pecten maximus]|uniref:trehalase-like n=1 Tax=Pecten maximus TaxID=6579 RepID=UPI001457F484